MSPVTGPLRSILMVGSSQVVSILVSIVRVKLIAIILGPAGIGLLGVFNNIKELGATIGGLGVATSGVRQIAQHSGDIEAQIRTRKLLLISLSLQGGVTALLIWLARDILADHLFANKTRPQELGIIAVSVWVGLVASAMNAVIQGMRRISELVRLTIYGALIGTIIGLSFILVLGVQGLPYLVLGLALGQLFATLWFFKRIGLSSKEVSFNLHQQIGTWISLIRLGIAFMAGTLATSATLLLVRGIVQQRLGVEALGQFEAAWALTMTYIGFVLNAMAADYFPRLSGEIHNPRVANAMVNEQFQLALILGGPLILATIGVAPIALSLFYSPKFNDAAPLLQMMTLGNILKLCSWSLGFTVVAKGRSGLFMLLQLNFNIVFATLLWWQIDELGPFAIGGAFIVAYCMQLIMTWMAARSIIDFEFEKTSLNLLISYFIAAVFVLLAVQAAPFAGGIAAVVMAGVGIVLGLRFLVATRGNKNPLASRVELAFARIGWPIQRQRSE